MDVPPAFSVTSERPAAAGVPSDVRLLCVGGGEPRWVNLALQLDAVGCHEPRLKWVAASSEALAAIRDEPFDAVVAIGPMDPALPFAPLRKDAIACCDLLAALRGAGFDEPVVVLSAAASDAVEAAAARLDCDVLVSPLGWDSPALVPVLARALRRAETARENRQLVSGLQSRLVRERDEAERLLEQQRDILGSLERLIGAAGPEGERDASSPHTPRQSAPAAAEAGAGPFPERIRRTYGELLKAYVMMGTGRLGTETATLAAALAQIDLAPRDALRLHLESVEELVRGLGNRSARHVMSRADLLAMELIVHLGEAFRQRAA